MSNEAKYVNGLIKLHLANKELHKLNNKSLTSFHKHFKAKLSSSRGIAPLRVNNIMLLNDKKKGQAFNNYFSSVFTIPTNEINTVELSSTCCIIYNIINFFLVLPIKVCSKLNLDTRWVLTYYD